ncbi:MAG: ABC transporter substrate-binding protein [Alphaproteobacteria bacterium]|nr:ABC transporter substrate-binding protein [Alphaproteobacteria bacterium]
MKNGTRRKIWIVAAVAAVAAVLFFLSGSRENVYGKPEVKIGAILDLAGGDAQIGQSALYGMRLAVIHMNKREGNKYFYRVVAEDSGFDIRRGLPIYSKLKNVDKIAALTTANSGIALAVRDHASADKILHISVSSSHDIADNKFNYVNAYEPDDMFAALARHLKSRGVKNIVVFGMNNPASAFFLGSMRAQMKAHNIEIVYESLFARGERDFATEAAKIRRINPDAVFLYSQEPEMSIAARALRVAGVEAPITGAFMFAYAADRRLFEGVEFVDFAKDGGEKFTADYVREFRVPPESMSLMSYDGAMIMMLAIEKHGLPKTWDESEVEGKLRGVLAGYVGVNEKIFMNERGVMHSAPVVKVMRDGKVEMLK